MSLDEALFQAINGVAGRSETVDWLMVQLARPRNLYYPGGLAAAYWLWRNWRECLIGSAALAGVKVSVSPPPEALGRQMMAGGRRHPRSPHVEATPPKD